MVQIRQLGITYLTAGGKRATDLAKLEDFFEVVLTGLDDNEVLAWDNASSKWINESVGSLGTVINHNSLASIQGGAPTDYYHFTSVQHTDLTDAGNSALHYHSTDRARANHTGTQLAATISDYTAAWEALWGAKSTTDLPEGTNLYFTDERAQDAVGGILVDSGSIDFTYDDATPSITATVIAGGVDHDSLSGVANSTAHSLFLLLSGTRAMTGNLNMASNAIYNVIDINAAAAAINVTGGHDMVFTISDTDGGDPSLSFYEATSGVRGGITALNTGTPPASGLNIIQHKVGVGGVIFFDLNEYEDEINMWKNLDMNGNTIINCPSLYTDADVEAIITQTLLMDNQLILQLIHLLQLIQQLLMHIMQNILMLKLKQ